MSAGKTEELSVFRGITHDFIRLAVMHFMFLKREK
jgi:hypothetical protein